jgi:hypothetical protein
MKTAYPGPGRRFLEARRHLAVDRVCEVVEEQAPGCGSVGPAGSRAAAFGT